MDEIYKQPDNVTQTELPNAKTVMILGIVSIPVCCIANGIFSLAAAIIALVMAGNAKSLFNANPNAYTETSIGNLKTGKTCAYIGLALGIFMLLITIILIAAFGFTALSDPQLLQEKLMRLSGQ
jgi:hypothetical protein